MSDLVNLGAEAKVKYLDGDFIIEVPGTHVFCAVTGKPILMEMLRYWNVDLQEAYYSPIEVNMKLKIMKKN